MTALGLGWSRLSGVRHLLAPATPPRPHTRRRLRLKGANGDGWPEPADAPRPLPLAGNRRNLSISLIRLSGIHEAAGKTDVAKAAYEEVLAIQRA